MTEYNFDVVWPNPIDSVQEEVVNFWLDEAAMPEGVARERASQLVLVVRCRVEGNVAAVSTAVPYLVESLGFRCYYFRTLIGKSHRAVGLRSSRLIHRVVRKSYDVLNVRFQQGLEPGILGLYLEVENASVMRSRRTLVWTDMGANIVYIGSLPTGRQARVWYFEDATLPFDGQPTSRAN